MLRQRQALASDPRNVSTPPPGFPQKANTACPGRRSRSPPDPDPWENHSAKGLIPHVEVAPTRAGLRAGKDEVLERALQDLEQTLAQEAKDKEKKAS